MKLAELRIVSSITALTTVLLVAGCASVPTGPSVMALPGTGKNFDQFRLDDASCRNYAQVQTGGSTANESGSDAGIKSAVVGTAVGAVAGAALGGHEGAGAGAATGLIAGSMAGAGAAEQSSYGSQQRYDNAYIQCMYAKGEKVPVPTSMVNQVQPSQQPAPATSHYYPPPPPGY